MKTKLICGLALLGAVATATAQPVTYTGTGVMTGSFNGTNFTETPFTITTVGDLGNIVGTDIGAAEGYPGSSIPSYTLAGTTTIQIDGFGLATFNGGDLFGVWAINFNSVNPGVAEIGFMDFGSVVDVPNNYSSFITTFQNTSDVSYDLSTATTLTGTIGADGELYSTDLGGLLISTVGNGANPNMIFTTSLEPAPEPSILALAGLGGISALVMLRRRK